jgi:hypothetical protein
MIVGVQSEYLGVFSMAVTQEEKNRVSRLRRMAKKLDYTLNIVQRGDSHESRRIKLTHIITGNAEYFTLPECEEFLNTKAVAT